MEAIAWKAFRDQSVRGFIKKTRRARLRSGFTLAELAIVILILSILLLIVFSVVGGIIRISTQTSPLRETKRQAFFALQNLKSSIDQSYYMSTSRRLWFVGRKDGVEGARKDRLTFAAVHPGAEDIGAPAVREVSYYLRDQEGKNYTLIRREDELVDSEAGKGGAHYEILRNVTSLQLRYSDKTLDWLDSWDTRKKRRLPHLVQIELRIEASGKEYAFQALSRPGMNIK